MTSQRWSLARESQGPVAVWKTSRPFLSEVCRIFMTLRLSALVGSSLAPFGARFVGTATLIATRQFHFDIYLATMDPWNGPAIRPECAGSGRVDDTAIKKKNPPLPRDSSTKLVHYDDRHSLGGCVRASLAFHDNPELNVSDCHWPQGSVSDALNWIQVDVTLIAGPFTAVNLHWPRPDQRHG